MTSERRWPRTLVKILFTSLSLAWLGYAVDLRPGLSRLSTVDVRRFGLALLLLASTFVIAAWRWQVLLRAQGCRLPLRRLADWLFVAHFFNQILPGSVGGDVVRVTDSASRVDSVAVAALVVFFDRLIGMIALLGFGCLGLALLASRNQALGAGMAAITLVALLVIAISASGRLQLRLERRPAAGRGRAAVLHAFEALRLFKRSPGAIAMALTGAFGTQLVLIAFYVTTAWAMDISLSVAKALSVVPAAMLLQAFPVSISGLGVREAAFAVGFTRAGLTGGEGIAVSLLGFAAGLLIAVAGAVRFMMRGAERPG